MSPNMRDVVVVLDACEIHRDWQLAGIDFQFLRFLTRPPDGLRVVVPNSVVTEVVANQGRELARAARDLRKALLSYRQVAGRDAVPLIEPAAQQEEYRRRLAGRLESCDFEVVASPEASHDAIAARAAERRAPFDQAGSGYRDTLVWLTCLALATQGKRVFLVTSDNDFAFNGELAPSLTEELADVTGSVTLVRHLGRWLTTLIPWQDVSDLKEAAASARDEEIASMFAPWDIFEDPHLTAEELGLPPSARLHDVSYAGSGGMWIDRKSFERVGPGRTQVVYEFPIEFYVEMTLNASDAAEAGFAGSEPNHASEVDVSTTVEMIGEMTVIHDEHDTDDGDLPYQYEWFNFRLANPTPEWPLGARSPIEPEGTPTLFDDDPSDMG